MSSNGTIYRLRRTPAGNDRYGDSQATGDPDRVQLDEAFYAPRTSADIDDRGRQGVIVGLTLYAPVGTDLVHTDQVEIDGTVYELDGEPGVWKHPMTGWQAGIEVALRKAVG